MLGAHPKMWSTGQLDYLEHLVEADGWCTCGERISACSFWNEVLGGERPPRMLNILYDPSGRTLPHIRKGLAIVRRLTPWSKRTDRAEAASGWDLLGRIASASGEEVIVDSSKGLLRLLKLLQMKEMRQRGRVIHLVRSAPGVVASTSTPRTAAMPDGTETKMRVLGKPLATLTWLVQNLLVGYVGLTRLGDRYMVVLYEDLVRNPRQVLPGICRFVGVEFDAAMLPPLEPDRYHLVGGNPSRFRGYSELRLDQRWKDRLKTHEKLMIGATTKWLERLLARRAMSDQRRLGRPIE